MLRTFTLYRALENLKEWYDFNNSPLEQFCVLGLENDTLLFNDIVLLSESLALDVDVNKLQE